MAKDPLRSMVAVGGVLIGVKPLLYSVAEVNGALGIEGVTLVLSGLPQGVGGKSALDDGVWWRHQASSRVEGHTVPP